MNILFDDRVDAGRQLARELASFASPDTVVVGLPRGGVPVAYEVARLLNAPTDVCIVRKIGAPYQEEFAIGAVAEDGVVHLHDESLRLLNLSDEEVAALVAIKRREVEDRVERFRRGTMPIDLRGKTVIVVDDGLATGSTAHAALVTLRKRGAATLILAVPVGSQDALLALSPLADHIVCLHPRADLTSVGNWYRNFRPTTDNDVVRILREAHAGVVGGDVVRTEPAGLDTDIEIAVDRHLLEGHLTVPADAIGIVLFAHGSGSSRHSARNKMVAAQLHKKRIGTLLFDLLTTDEGRIDERTGELRFNIGMLALRLVAATDSIQMMPQIARLNIGYFGASTGAAAALVASAERRSIVRAVVSRGGRPDLAADILPTITAPTLLIVGSADTEVLQLNHQAYDRLSCEKELDIVNGATHLFPEPGALEHVAHSAIAWFTRYFTTPHVP